MNTRVEELRKKLNLTMESFGKKLGVTRSAISNIENGKRNLTDQMVISICREFNVNEDWLRTGQGKMFAPTPGSEFDAFVERYEINDFERSFLEKYIKLSRAEREAVTRFMSALSPEALAFDTIPDSPEELESQYPPVQLHKKDVG